MAEPNAAQRALIEGTEGLVLVDAGPGTGKTFALTRRYARIVDRSGVEPDDVLLATFTRTAATEMRERVVARSAYGMGELRDAPIGTFHGRCHDLLLEHGFAAPTYLGIDDRITRTTRVLEDDLVEAVEFRRFFDRFTDDHPEHADVARAVSEPGEVRALVNTLAATGVFPTAEGWYRTGERRLDGDLAAFRRVFDGRNRPRNEGDKQSELRERLAGYGRDACYRPDAPSRAELRGDGPAVPGRTARLAFEEDRDALKRFVHDVYHGYLAYALSRNYLTFGMLQGFAFVLLCEDHALREALSFEYVMVDEFQDTSEIQFKLALLQCGSANLCVVGDWKQSIYGFQDAAVENITEFEARLSRFADELNDDRRRVTVGDGPVERIELTENYRSTQAILEFAEQGLVVPATGREAVDAAAVRDRVVSLHANRDRVDTRIEAVQHEDEPGAVLTTLQAVVGNDDYAIEADGERRAPRWGDVAVLTRTTDFGRELLQAARAHGIPMAYEGGIELFRTDQAKLVLAWLRILEADGERGWAVVLERAGYAMAEIEHVLATGAYPADMAAFAAELAALERVGAVAERVLARYGYDGSTADVVIETLQDAHDATTMTRGDLIRLVERGIETGATREVSAPAGTDAVTVQTIHAAKGLEYPIVVLANVNRYRFPSTGGGRSTLRFDDPVGLRQATVFDDAHGDPHVYDNWHADALRRCLPTEYDEERRLLYVAMTRAESHLLFSAGAEPSPFLEALPVDVEEREPDVRPARLGETVQTTFRPTISPPEGPVGLSAHDLMDDAVFERTDEGMGRPFGIRVHEFAEAYARGEAVDPGGDEPDWASVTAFVDGLTGERLVEREAVLPLEVDGHRVAIAGVVDLVHVLADRVELVDYKTDRSRAAADEYATQVSVYYHVLDAWYPDRDVDAFVFYTATGDRVRIDPRSVSELAGLAREHPRVAGLLGD